MTDSPPMYMFVRNLFSPMMCDELVKYSERGEGHHWDRGAGTFGNGTQTQLLSRADPTGVVAAGFNKLETTSKFASAVFNIEIDFKRVQSCQITKWTDKTYPMHHDCDLWKRLFLPDTKLSIYISLDDNGGLEFEKDGWINCNKGDALIFNSFLHHAVTDHRTKTRYSMVVWIIGPRWR